MANYIHDDITSLEIRIKTFKHWTKQGTGSPPGQFTDYVCIKSLNSLKDLRPFPPKQLLFSMRQ